MGYFDSKNLFLNRGELSITSREELLSVRAINFDLFAPFVSGKTILDVGCCDGRWSAWMLDHGASYVHGIDIEPKFINDGALVIMPTYFTSDKYSFEVADILQYQPNMQFDAVALFSVIYFQNPIQMIEKACSISDVVMVDTAVNTIGVNGDPVNESEIRGKFAELGFEITDLEPINPIEDGILFVATKVSA